MKRVIPVLAGIIVAVFAFAVAGTSPAFAANSCAGSADWSNGRYGGGWKTTSCTIDADGAVTGQVKITGNGSCRGEYALRGRLKNGGIDGKISCGRIEGILFVDGSVQSQWGSLRIYNASFSTD